MRKKGMLRHPFLFVSFSLASLIPASLPLPAPSRKHKVVAPVRYWISTKKRFLSGLLSMTPMHHESPKPSLSTLLAIFRSNKNKCIARHGLTQRG
ncbi:exported hypothetical protein [Aeromonas veronii]|uniref:Secreted protein n=1 Tax=Aeromonas veronii TaxID=654 RepID=A0A653KS64_AERVE|nr:exported hypothetical protein [Aeromonas veronii]